MENQTKVLISYKGIDWEEERVIEGVVESCDSSWGRKKLADFESFSTPGPGWLVVSSVAFTEELGSGCRPSENRALAFL